ncbi:MAG: lysozyme [Planctomycetes bacterium]|nr:lysozyme [Planctomycetota bacterium]
MTDDDFDRELELQLIDHEDLKLKPYRCSAGKLTIGVGRNLDDNGITKTEAMMMLRSDITSTRFALEKAVPGFLGFSIRRRRALIDMCFNLGLPRFLQFKQMLAAIKVGDFNRAAEEMLSSVWAKQVGQRAQTLATMMREG